MIVRKFHYTPGVSYAITIHKAITGGVSRIPVTTPGAVAVFAEVKQHLSQWAAGTIRDLTIDGSDGSQYRLILEETKSPRTILGDPAPAPDDNTF